MCFKQLPLVLTIKVTGIQPLIIGYFLFEIKFILNINQTFCLFYPFYT